MDGTARADGKQGFLDNPPSNLRGTWHPRTPLIQGDRQREQTIIRESRENPFIVLSSYYNVEDHDLNWRLKLDEDPRDPPLSLSLERERERKKGARFREGWP